MKDVDLLEQRIARAEARIAALEAVQRDHRVPRSEPRQCPCVNAVTKQRCTSDAAHQGITPCSWPVLADRTIVAEVTASALTSVDIPGGPLAVASIVGRARDLRDAVHSLIASIDTDEVHIVDYFRVDDTGQTRRKAQHLETLLRNALKGAKGF